MTPSTPCNKHHPNATYLAHVNYSGKATYAPVICTRTYHERGPHRGYGAGMRIIEWSDQ